VGQDLGDAVQALELGVAMRGGHGRIVLYAGALDAGEYRDGLEPCALPSGQVPSLNSRLDLSDRHREDWDDASLVVG
jgi:hypothetical protein